VETPREAPHGHIKTFDLADLEQSSFNHNVQMMYIENAGNFSFRYGTAPLPPIY